VPKRKPRKQSAQSGVQGKQRVTRELRSTAYHEAGHAVAIWFYGRKFKKASIIPNEKEGTLGHVLGIVPKWLDPKILEMGGAYGADERRHRYYAEQRMIELFAGAAAESRYLRHHVSTGWEHDLRVAHDYASCFCGSSRTTSAFLEYTRCAAADLVRSHWWVVAIVARELIRHRELSYDNVQEAIRRGAERRVK
jgi:hypothetical protein